MGLLSRQQVNPDVRAVAMALAAGVPLAAFLATAGAHDFWLDSGEFAAQAIDLDIAHPPGHPVAGLVGRLATLLIPIGPISLRVALGQAICTAIASVFLYRALETTVRSAGVEHSSIAIPLALGGTWLTACSYGWWFQSVRAEVYALQAMLVMIALERIVTLEARWPTRDVRPLYAASLALGLGLANHHLIAFLAMPAIAPTLARVYRAKGARPLLYAGLALALGLSTYLYLPIRASADPPLNLGDPTNFQRLFWVVSAKVYAKNVAAEITQPLFERFLDVLILLGESIGGFMTVGDDSLLGALRALGLVGAILVSIYLVLRFPGVRRVASVWVILFVVNILFRAWMGPVRANPDILGYLMPGFAGAAAILTAAAGVIFANIGGDARPRAAAVVLAIGFAALGLAQIRGALDRSSLEDFQATDAFDDERIRRLPEDAIVLVHRPQSVFRHWALTATEQARPDITMVPMPFLGYPGVVDALLDAHPNLRPLLRTYELEGELRQPELQNLAVEHPVFVEMDVRVPRELYDQLVPDGLYYRIVDAGATRTDVRQATAHHDAIVSRLSSQLGEIEHRETRGNLLWIHYMDALFYAGIGEHEFAAAAVGRALSVNPESEELQALEQTLQDPEIDGPIDIAPFIARMP